MLDRKNVCHPFYPRFLTHNTISSGQCPPLECSIAALPLRKSLAAFFPEPFEPPFSSTTAKNGKLPERKSILQLFEGESRLLYVLYMYAHIHQPHPPTPTPQQTKDNNKTQNKQEACKISIHDSSSILPGGNLRTVDSIFIHIKMRYKVTAKTIHPLSPLVCQTDSFNLCPLDTSLLFTGERCTDRMTPRAA